MFKFPSQAYVHREFPLKDVIKVIQVGNHSSQETKNIAKIYVEYVFNERTTNLSFRSIKEIHVYRIELKDYNVPEGLILALDKKDRFQTLFAFYHDGMELDCTGPKTNDGKKVKYANSEWRKAGDDVELPHADSLDELYCFIYGSFNDYKPFKGEELGDYIKRNNELKKLDYQISKTQSAIMYEKQSKKRLEYNHNLNQYKERRELLLNQRRLENAKIEESIQRSLTGEPAED